MKKKYYLTCGFFPFTLILLFYSIAYIEAYIMPSSFLMSIYTAIGFFGIIFAVPIYLIIVTIYYIKKYKMRFHVTIVTILSITVIDALAMYPNAILVYMKIKSPNTNDVDLFPIYIVIPILIFLICFSIYYLRHKD